MVDVLLYKSLARRLFGVFLKLCGLKKEIIGGKKKGVALFFFFFNSCDYLTHPL